MSRRHQLMRSPVHLAAPVVACFAVALTLGGCGAGTVTQTDGQVAAIDGASTDVGGIALRDVLVPYPEDADGVYPAGSDVTVQLTIVNQGDSADTLMSVRSPAAGRVLVEGTPTIPAGMSLASRGESEQETAQTTTPTTTAAPGTTPTPATTGPAGPLDVGEVRIVLAGTTRDLRPGQNVELTFVFRNAGTVTLPVPMGPPPTGSERHPLEEGGDGHS